MFTSAYFTLIVPLIVFSGNVAHFRHILPDLDPIVQYGTIRERYFATIVSASKELRGGISI